MNKMQLAQTCHMLNPLKRFVSTVTGQDEDIIYARGRKAYTLPARGLYCYLAVTYYNLNYSHVGMVLDRHRTSVRNMVERFQVEHDEKEIEYLLKTYHDYTAYGIFYKGLDLDKLKMLFNKWGTYNANTG